MKLIDRLRRLEASAPNPATARRHILVDLIAAGGRVPLEERERRIAEAKQQARLQDLVIVVDCSTRAEA